MSRGMWAIAMLVITLGSSTAVAQTINMGNSSTISDPQRTVMVVPHVVSIDGSGLLMTCKALKAIDSRHVHIGERFAFELMSDIRQKNGQVVIPKGAHIQTVVTEAISRNPEQPESRLALRLERATWEHGTATLNGGVASILQVPGTSVRHNADHHPEAAEIPYSKQIAADNNAWEMQSFIQRDVSPGSTPIGYEEGRDLTAASSLATDQRLLAMEDVSLQRDDKGVALVSKKKNVKVEKWTYMLLRAESLQ